MKLPPYNPFSEFERSINPNVPAIEGPIAPPIEVPKGYIRLRSEDTTFVIDLPEGSELIEQFIAEGCTLELKD